jgi:hypothetical protein
MSLKISLRPQLRFDNITQKLKAQLEEQKRANLRYKQELDVQYTKNLESNMRTQVYINPLKLALQKQKEAQLIQSNIIQFQTEQGLMEQLELTYKC